MNVWNFTGNLGKDAEVKYTAGGMAVMSFSVAVKSGYGDKEKTTWVNCGVFGKRAEGSLPQYLVKGAQVAISGEAFLDEWEKDGVTNKMLKVNVDKLDLIGGRSDSAPQQQRQAPQQRQQQAPQQQNRPAPQQAQRPQQNQGQQQYQQQQQQNQQPPMEEGWDQDIPF
jgi:single-strand DNA-binding protein